MSKGVAPTFRNEFFGAPYKFRGKSKGEGFDCMSLLHELYTNIGKELPDLSDVYDVYEKDKSSAFVRGWTKIFRITEEIDVAKIVVGDLLLLDTGKGYYYPGVFLGNGSVGSCFTDKGVAVVGYNSVKVVQARRFK